MAVRFRIGDLLVVIALVGLFAGFFAPELRSWDRNSAVVFSAVGILTALTAVSFSPVWAVLLHLRRRARRGLGIRAVHYVAVIAAIFSSIGILVGILLAVAAMVGR